MIEGHKVRVCTRRRRVEEDRRTPETTVYWTHTSRERNKDTRFRVYKTLTGSQSVKVTRYGCVLDEMGRE